MTFTQTKKGKVIIVLGTTASGKTRLAVNIAKKFNGEIISGDSRQVYKGMDIGTGKDMKEYGKVPYHLIDIVSPKKQFTVAEFQEKAYKAIEDILKREKLPIICGGTGLYIDAVTKGLKFTKLRITNYEFGKIRRKFDKRTLKQLLKLLREIDPATYKIIDKKNRRRVQRALEIYYETGIPKSRQENMDPPPYEFLKIGVTFPRAVLNKRIEKRLDERLKEGMIAEVKRLHARGVSWKRLDGFGLEYRWVSRYIRGMISKEEMREKLFRAICHFAKRQMTWFRRDKDIHWMGDAKEVFGLIRKFLK